MRMGMCCVYSKLRLIRFIWAEKCDPNWAKIRHKREKMNLFRSNGQTKSDDVSPRLKSDFEADENYPEFTVVLCVNTRFNTTKMTRLFCSKLPET